MEMKRISTGEIRKMMDSLRIMNKYSDEILELIRDDLEYGLTQKQVELYYKRDISFERMKIFSRCLRENRPIEDIEVLIQKKLSVNQMKVSLEFYEKGVPIATIKEIMSRDDTPQAMKAAYTAILNALEKVKNENVNGDEYIERLVTRMEDAVNKINENTKRYDELDKRLIQTGPDKDSDKIMNEQQDMLNKAHTTIARFRKQIEKNDEEMEKMQRKIGELQEKIRQLEEEKDASIDVPLGNEDRVNKDTGENLGDKTANDVSNIDSSELKAVEQVETEVNPVNDYSSKNTYTTPETEATDTSIPNVLGMPVYFSIIVRDRNGNYVQQLPLERTQRKSNRATGLFARFVTKKKSRQSLIRLIADGDLCREQLEQIKIAMSRGLTEDQLFQLISKKISADRMKEIIDIAVIENSMI